MLGWVAAGLVLGVAGAGWWAAVPWTLCCLPVLGLNVLPLWARGPLLVVMLVGPAAWWVEVRRPIEAPTALSRQAPQRFVRLEGTLSSAPEVYRDGWRAEVVSGTDRLLVTFPSTDMPMVGDRRRFAGRLTRPDGPRNPGDFDYQTFLARRGIFATLRAEESTLMGQDSAYAGWRQVHLLRRHLLAGLSHGLSPDHAALLGSLVLGSGAAPVSEETEQAFRRAGLSHMLAASGAQVALLAGLLYQAGRQMRLPPAGAALLTAPVLLLYLALTGAPPSMVRATLMGLVGLGAIAFHKREVPFSALWLAAILMVAWEPACLLDLGFQFSFLATYGLMRLGYWLTEAEVPVSRGLVALAAVPLVAWIWVSPWQAATFQTWVPYSLPANISASFFVMALTPCGLTLAMLGIVWPAAVSVLNVATTVLLGALTTLVSWFASLPGAESTAPAMSSVTLVGIYGALWCGWRHRQAAIVLGLMAVISLPQRAPKELHLAFLSVGQGDAIVLRTPGDRWVLVDGGLASPDIDMGQRVVVPYLRRIGCKAIDLMVATHAHADHVGGLTAVTRAMPVRRAWDAGQDEPSVAQQQLLAAWLATGVPWAIARPGRHWAADGVHVETLGPFGPGEDVNDGSLVLRVTYGAFSAVLAGDMGADGEARIMRRNPRLRADVLKVGHHGSRTSSSEPWIRQLRPRLAVVSVGARNVFKHPHPDVMQRLRRHGTLALRTDRDRAVLVRSDGRRWAIATGADDWRRWRLLAGRHR